MPTKQPFYPQHTEREKKGTVPSNIFPRVDHVPHQTNLKHNSSPLPLPPRPKEKIVLPISLRMLRLRVRHSGGVGPQLRSSFVSCIGSSRAYYFKRASSALGLSAIMCMYLLGVEGGCKLTWDFAAMIRCGGFFYVIWTPETTSSFCAGG